MWVLSAALWAALACVASSSFRGDFAPIFNTWSPSEDVRLVEDFDHLTQIFHPQVHEAEHSRRKRNADETARFSAVGSPITHACNRPGYTGQYCEFPICEQLNPTPNPNQFLRDEGYVVDLTDLGNCTHLHKIIVDESMYDVRIDVQSLDNVSPRLTIIDENGYIASPDGIVRESDRYIAHFNKLPAGAYSVQPSAASTKSRCILTTTAQTTLTISGGFQTDDRDRNDFPNENAAAHQFNSIMLTLHGARAPAALKTVSVVGPENYILRPRVLDKRYGCQYEFYFDSLFCYERGSYAMIVEGIDFFGNFFRRVAPFECVNTPAPTTSSAPPTTPQPTNPTSCANGGVSLANRGKTTCICQDHWTGYDCSQALCINGGTRLEGKCFCPVGFEGTHCEQVKCEPNSNHGFGVDRPTLVFIVRARKAQNPILAQVQRAIDDVVANMQFDPTYFSRFHLVIFNNQKIIKSKHYTSINDFDWDFELDATQSTDTFGGCYDDVLGAVATALTDVSLTQGSTVYVITDALAEDYTTQIEGISQMNSFWRAAINFVYVEPDKNQVGEWNQCVSDISDPGFRAFDEVANRFGGLAWHIEDRKNVHDVMYSHMNSVLYKSQLMLTLDREECSKGLGKVIQVENNAETLVFVSRGSDFHLDITNPEGDALKLMTIVKEGQFSVMRWGEALAGTYLVRASTDAPNAACSLRAYQASVHTTPSYPQTEVYWAISTDVDTDAMMYQPLAGMDNHPVFHVEDFGDDVDHAFAFLNMYAVRNGVEKEVYASNGLYRGGCTFQFYFPSFRCRANENLHYEFNLRNEEGFYVQRAGVMTCFNYVPTPSAPTDCQHGGVKYNGTCLCQSHYEGEHCDNLICENGGTPVFGNCQCPAGWTGPFCAYPQCSEQGPLPSYGYHADMAFLVEVSPKGIEQINQLLVNLPEIIRDVSSQHNDWIDRVVLIGYNQQGVIGMVDTPIANANWIFDALQQWAQLPQFGNECSARIWAALDTLLNDRYDGAAKRELPARSIINIFEASIPQYGLNDNSLIYSTGKGLLEKRAIVNVFQGKDWKTDECDGSKDDFRWLEQVARRGDGMIYDLSNNDLVKAIRMIPTLFSSSIVYKYSSKDCSRQENVYFPIDAYTQTVTAIVLGQDAAIDLRRKDGTSLSDDMRVDILDNSRNVIVEYRNPCDSDWEAVSQYCIYYSKAVKRNFADAFNLCESMDAFMVADLNEDKNRWLSLVLGGKQAWLGLVYVNGDWCFQSDNGGCTLPPKNFNKWTTGEAPADDAKGGCAYFYNGLWYPMFCDREYVVVCQKHMYNQHNEPSDLGDSDLSPGHYYLVVQTDLRAENPGCEVEIRVQSDLNVEYGFVDGLRRDTPHPVGNIDSDDNRVVSSVSIGKARAQNSILEHVMWRSDDPTSVLLEAATYSYRLGCSYEFVSQPLNCDLTLGLDFSVVMIGEDDTGNTFQRYSTSFCSKWYDCQNGGVYSNGQCLCADYFTGDQCETPMCQNGGTLVNGNSCRCRTGFGGPACQSPRCSYLSKPAFTNDGKAFIFVLEKSANTADAIEKIGNDIEELVQTIRDKHVGWISRWMILSFAMDGSIDALEIYYTNSELKKQLLAVAEEARELAGGCQMPIFKALGELFDSPLDQYLPGAEVMIVSAAAPSDADLAAIHATMENFDIQTPVVDFLHIETEDCPISNWAKDFGDFADFLSTTGGLVFRVPAKNAALALTQFVPTRYAVASLSYADPLKCKDNDIYVQVDTSMTIFYLMVGSPGATIKITPPNQYDVHVFLMWNSDGQSLWSVYPKFPGIYKIMVNADGPACFPVVYGSVGSLIYLGPHAAQVFSGFIQNYNTGDFPTPYAVYGAVNFPVFNLFNNGYELPATEFLTTARMTRRTIDGNDEESYTSDVDFRVHCAYTYVGKAFTCVEENDVITLSVSGVDSYNQPFTRQSTTYCKAAAPAKNLQYVNNTNV